MKVIIRGFFKTVRWLLGPIMLLWERLTTPSAVVRDPEQQAQIDARSRHLALYQFKTCPFCIKVRREIARHALRIEVRDAQHDARHRQTLLDQGGQIKVPCLRIRHADGRDVWLYESKAIIHYLTQLSGSTETATTESATPASVRT